MDSGYVKEALPKFESAQPASKQLSLSGLRDADGGKPMLAEPILESRMI